MILDKAPETILVWPVVELDDGYRGTRPGMATRLPDGTYDPPEGAPITAKAFVMPMGYAGAGWAANLRYSDQGYANVSRVNFVVKFRPGLLAKWGRVEALDQEWTVNETPRLYSSRRMKYLTAMAELRGDAHGS